MRPATPVRFSIVGRCHPGEDRAAPGVPASEGRCVWRMRTWRDGGLPREKGNQSGGDLQKWGGAVFFPQTTGADITQFAHLILEARTAQEPRVWLRV